VTFVLDTPTWCLYSAEGSIDPGVVFPDIATARAMLRRILRSRWWSDRYPDGPRILLRRRSIVDDDGGFESFARPVTEWLPTAWRIELHEAHLNPMVLMHEIAHCIAPRWTGNVAEIHRDRATGARRAHHDGVFAAIYSEMVGQFGTGTNSADLAEAYAHYQVPVAALADVRSAIDLSNEVEAAALAFRQCLDEENVRLQAETRGSSRPAGRVPTLGWGEALWLSRRRAGTSRRKLSQEAVAELVSAAEPCSRHDIAKIERLKTMPDDRRSRRVAMSMAVALGIDPVWCRTALGLARWDCSIELWELKLVNHKWVELVDELNEMIQTRPPLWAVEGGR